MSSTIEVRAPAEQSEGTRLQLQRWLKAVGDSVAENEPLIEVETDKVTVEIAAPGPGILQEILKHESEDIAPGELLGRIRVAGAEDDSAPLVAKIAVGAARGADHLSRNVTEEALSAHAAALSAGSMSPAVRRLLAEHGVAAAEIHGSGRGGRITAQDVLDHVARAAASADKQVAGVRRVPHSSMRKRIAERMVQSLLHTAPHVTTVFEADLGAVLAHRARHRAELESRGASLTLTAYFLAACVDAIRAVPEVNSRWTDEALEIFDAVDIGVATAIEGKGLLVPVVRNVQSLDLFGIARELGELVRRAREDQLTPANVRGGTFTISNHGVSGSLVATPIVIHQPQSAILGIGKLEKRAVVVTENGEDRIVVRPRCYVTLTLDHRVMDGERANRFLAILTERLERWGE
jgi:2-oxoglutarate dehydrogenase E2 component (dihydrolipoamide succinyltransferase)